MNFQVLIRSDTPKRYVSIFGNDAKILTPLGSDKIFATSTQMATIKFLAG
jgi:hypothetical protein